MGLLDKLWGSSNGAVDKLDPELRDYLEKGSKSSSSSSPATEKARPPPPFASEARPESEYHDALRPLPRAPMATSRPNPETGVPPESLYQDGRYAHLWKTYQPASAVDGPTNDTDMVKQMTDSIRDAKHALRRTAEENCLDEAAAMLECGRTGGWYARMTMCRTETRANNRCLTMQNKLLKALGYQTLYTKLARDEGLERAVPAREGQADYALEVESSWDSGRLREPLERMQMHADRLYREMLAREEAANEAARLGQSPDQAQPVEPIASRENLAKAGRPDMLGYDFDSLYEHLPTQKKAEYNKRLKKLEGEALELEKRVIESEDWDRIRGLVEYAEARKKEKIDRLERKRTGQLTVGDWLKHMGGWSQE